MVFRLGVNASGVGSTAVLMTYGRAVETERADRLFADPWARHFVDASGWIPPDPAQTTGGRAGPTGASWLVMWTRIFEVDTDEVLDFKQAVLRDIGAIVDLPTERIPLPVDVTQDLTDPLVAAGFSPSAPSAWVAEGLLLYLTAEQNDSLLTSVSGLAVADSPLLLTLTPAGQHARDEATASQGCGVHNPFRVSDGPDDPVGWLTEFGWRLTVASGVPGQ